jgi:hypothetical protein
MFALITRGAGSKDLVMWKRNFSKLKNELQQNLVKSQYVTNINNKRFVSSSKGLWLPYLNGVSFKL